MQALRHSLAFALGLLFLLSALPEAQARPKSCAFSTKHCLHVCQTKNRTSNCVHRCKTLKKKCCLRMTKRCHLGCKIQRKKCQRYYLKRLRTCKKKRGRARSLCLKSAKRSRFFCMRHVTKKSCKRRCKRSLRVCLRRR